MGGLQPRPGERGRGRKKGKERGERRRGRSEGKEEGEGLKEPTTARSSSMCGVMRSMVD